MDTDKSIIIDGVNVAECEHLWKDNSVIDLNFCRINFDNNYFSNGIPCCDKCNKHPDCYFKQLQRAKAELEQYKKSKQASYEAMQVEWNKAVNELRELKAENEKLKEKINSYICSANCYKYKEAEKYRKALEEIKIITNNLKEDTGRYNIYDLSDKINEVLD